MTKRILLTLLTLAVASIALYSVAEAKYSSSNLISNAVFTNTKTMTAPQIQSFLNSKGGGMAKKSWNGKRASDIIYQASQDWGINPQVILATLQKEQSLVTDPSPSTTQYRSAMGYGCPDQEKCKSEYGAFESQVVNGTWQLRFNYERANRNNSWYNPATTYPCRSGDTDNNPPFYNNGLFTGNKVTFSSTGGRPNKTITIANAATASLYCYTPHVGPLSETGYSGSYNFVTNFESWFGPTVTQIPYVIRYDTTTDKLGEQGKIGFGLHSKPSSDVTLTFAVSSPSNAKIIGSHQVKISRETWNKPEKNVIVFAGRNNKNLNGSIQYQLVPTESPISRDLTYKNLPVDFIPSIEILHEDSSSSRKVYRLKNSSLQQHTFTSNINRVNELISDGWTTENSGYEYCSTGEQSILQLKKGSQYKLAIQNSRSLKEDISNGFKIDSMAFSTSTQGSIPVYYMYNDTNPENIRSLYTVNKGEVSNDTGWKDGGIAFYGCQSDSEPVYRLYKPGGSHFYTSSPRERDKAIYDLKYRYEGLGFYACTNGPISVHRFIKESTGVRFYTTSEREKSKVINTLKGYRYEGIGFNLCLDGSTNVYRHYQQESGRRFFTTSKGESDAAISTHKYRLEGVGFKSL